MRRWSSAVCPSGINNAATNCTDGQASPGGSDWGPTFNQTWKAGQYRTQAGLVRYQIVEAHCYPSSFPTNPTAPRYAPAGRPVPIPVSLPQSVRDQLLGRGWPQGYETGPVRLPNSEAAYGAAISVTQSPDGRTRVNVRPNPRPQPRPNPQPKPKDKERKSKQQKIAAFLWGLLSTMSEARDVIEALHQGVPNRLRGGVRSHDTFGQLGNLIEHWDRIDWGRAGIAVAANEIEDRILGYGFRKASEAGRFGPIDIERQLGWLDSYVHGWQGRDDTIESARRMVEKGP